MTELDGDPALAWLRERWGSIFDVGWDVADDGQWGGAEYVATRRDDSMTVFAPTARALDETLTMDSVTRLALSGQL